MSTRFGGTVIQVVVHRFGRSSARTSSFGGMVIQVVVHLWILQFKYAIRFAIMAEFRTYRNPSSSSPSRLSADATCCFGNTVIQVVVHRRGKGRQRRAGFGGTISQAVAHRMSSTSPTSGRFGSTVNQAVVHPDKTD